MGQYWILSNIDIYQFTCEAGGRLGNLFWESKTDFAKLLVRISPKDMKPLDIWPNRGIATLDRELSRTSKLLRLPNELIRSIFDKVDDIPSCICLYVAHHLLSAVGEARLRELLVSKLGPWAGHRIICCGNYCHGFPSNTEDEISSQMKAYFDTGHHPGTSFYYYALHIYQWVGPRRLRGADHKRLEAVIATIKRNNIYVTITAKDLVLCNLSKGEYVRNDTVMDFATKVQAASVYGVEVDLGLVLFSRICWSTDDSCAMSESISSRLAAGTWAGDRSEIVPLGKMNSEIDWKDVTEEALAWVREVYEANLGPLDL